MKQKDIILIVVVGIISGIVSLFISNALFAPPATRQQQIEKVGAISSSFSSPDSKYFNSQSVDPTQLIQIGTSTNPNPFNKTAGQ